MLLIAFITDKIKQCIDRKKRKQLAQFNVDDFYRIINAKQDKRKQEVDSDKVTVEMPPESNKVQEELQKYLREVFQKDRIEEITPEEIDRALQPNSVISDRLQFRKNLSIMLAGQQKVNIAKGLRIIEELKSAQEAYLTHELNPKVGFKCLHYTVTEKAGFVRVVITKRNEEDDVQIGVRTIDGTATATVDDTQGDYEPIDQVVKMSPGVNQFSIPIRINEDEEVEPDEDFFIEIYDLKTNFRLPGADTKATVTILDDDKPGIFGFELRATKVRSKDEKIRLRVIRKDGGDDNVVINYKSFSPDLPNAAQPTVDYTP